jgi:GGDEF domain-containing protein
VARQIVQMGNAVNPGASVGERRSALWRRQGLWWLLSGVGLLLLVQLLGLAPPVLDSLAPGLGQDLAMMLGLLGGTVLASLLLGRAPSNEETGLRDRNTGLLLPRHADEIAGTLVARDVRAGDSRLVLAVMVLDEADALIKRYGKEPMERLLAMVAETLKTQCRGADLPFRLSKRELAVYLHCGGLEQAEAFRRRMQMLLGSQQLDWHGDVLKPGVRMGMAVHRPGLSLTALRVAARERLAD